MSRIHFAASLILIAGSLSASALAENYIWVSSEAIPAEMRSLPQDELYASSGFEAKYRVIEQDGVDWILDKKQKSVQLIQAYEVICKALAKQFADDNIASKGALTESEKASFQDLLKNVGGEIPLANDLAQAEDLSFTYDMYSITKLTDGKKDVYLANTISRPSPDNLPVFERPGQEQSTVGSQDKNPTDNRLHLLFIESSGVSEQEKMKAVAKIMLFLADEVKKAKELAMIAESDLFAAILKKQGLENSLPDSNQEFGKLSFENQTALREKMMQQSEFDGFSSQDESLEFLNNSSVVSSRIGINISVQMESKNGMKHFATFPLFNLRNF